MPFDDTWGGGVKTAKCLKNKQGKNRSLFIAKEKAKNANVYPGAP